MQGALLNAPTVTLPKWFDDLENLNLLANHLHTKGDLTHAKSILAFYDSPWKWNLEWQRFEREELSRRD